MFDQYYVKKSKQRNDISCCNSKNTKFIYTIYTTFSRESIKLIIKKYKYVFLFQNYKIFLFKIKI